MRLSNGSAGIADISTKALNPQRNVQPVLMRKHTSNDSLKTGDPAKPRISRMSNYRCMLCGFVYSPDIGDPVYGIDPGTPFEDLPDDWVCPVCGADKNQFEKENQL